MSPGSGEKHLKQEERYQSFDTETQNQSWRENTGLDTQGNKTQVKHISHQLSWGGRGKEGK